MLARRRTFRVSAVRSRIPCARPAKAGAKQAEEEPGDELRTPRVPQASEYGFAEQTGQNVVEHFAGLLISLIS